MPNLASPFPPALDSLFKVALEVHVEENTRYFLDEKDFIWFLDAFEGDIFAFDPNKEDFIPIFLQEVGEGDCIFGYSSTDSGNSRTFFFISSKPAILYKIPLAPLKKVVLKDVETRDWMADKVEKWVGKLLTLIAPKEPPKKHQEFSVSGESEIPARAHATLQFILDPTRKKRLGWVSCINGEIEWEGNPLMRLKGGDPLLYPLSSSLWITALSDSRIKSYTTLEALEFDEFWNGLQGFHQLLFPFFELQKRREIKNRLEKGKKKKILEEEADRESIRTLGSLLEKGKAYYPAQAGDALFKACDLIGQVLNVQMVLPKRIFPIIDDQVKEIATISGLFHRKITLKDRWWESAIYPILAFYGEEKKPVALINVSSTEFEFQNPDTLERVKVTEENASRFFSNAFVFHVPYAGNKITFSGLIKFSYKEAIRETIPLVILAVLTAIVNLFLPYAMKVLVDSLSASANITLLIQLALGLVLAAITLWVFAIAKNFATQRFNGISNNKLQIGLWGRILNFPASFFRKSTSGELMNNFMSVVSVHSTINEVLIPTLFSGVYALFYLIQMFTFSVILTVIALLSFLIPTLIYIVCATFQIRKFKALTDLSGIIQGFVLQIIGGVGKIRVAGAESRFFQIWSKLFARKKKLFLSYQKIAIVTQLTSTLFPLAVTVVIYIFAVSIFQKEVQNYKPTLTLGTFVGFTTAFGLFISSALDVLKHVFEGLRIRPLWQNAQFLLEQQPEKSLDKERAPPFKGKVVIDHISFRYNPDDDLTLENVTIQALPGEMVGIIGPSGSGKSTLVRLLLGFEQPESGAIYYDDKDLEDMDPRSVRAQIGTVLQNASLMAGSIYDNIVGSGTYPPEAIEKAIRFAGFEADLERLPMGLNTVIPMGGGTISGGQKQRLLLARALVSSPKILILDEATSALDNTTQDFVSTNLDNLRVTRLVIAHRLSTIKNADRIYVIDKGRVVQEGTFKQLAQEEGLFLSMLKRQLL